MYAVAEISGKQYFLEEGKTVAVDRLNLEVGSTLDIDKVCLLKDDAGQVRLGKPYLGGVVVKAKLEKNFRGRKVVVFFFRQKKDSKKKRGHRQEHSLLKIEKIEA